MHADRPTDGGPLTTAHRDLLRMFAEGVGVSCEQRILAARVERQRQHVIEVCQAAMESARDTTPTPGIALRPKKCVDVDQLRLDQSALPRLPHASQARDSRRMNSLTSREREVLALLASGATNSQLADQLTVAESTIKSHVKHILHKLGASNRAAAISYYVRDTRCGDRSAR
ncbi:helix-turn-helix transcriptional regulator [Mycobacteroides abscessus]|nr:LuxR C-terminal-related transcriptional regulator [Mycobacteroides abscessus]